MLNRIFALLCSIAMVFAHSDHGDDDSGHGHQKRTSPKICEIKGTVVDSATVFPIEYASISLLNEKGDILTGTISDADGDFSIRELASGTYSLKIEFMGFESMKIDDINLSFKENRSFNIGKLKLKSTVLLADAVEVIDDAPIMENQIDKKVFNVSQMNTPAGGTGEEVLSSIPAVSVDMDGVVSLRGNSNVRILVNGKPSALISRGETTSVENLPADMIDKVEVITSPSAKYDPEGMAGIINIVLKKGKFEGFNGDLSGTVGERNKYNASANVNYFTGKLNVFSSFSYKDRTRSRNGGRDYARKNIGAEKADSLSQHSDTEIHFIADAISFGGDFIINDLNSLSFSYNRANHIDTSTSTFTIKEFDVENGGLTSSESYSNVNLEDGVNSDFSLTYFKDFEEKGHELTVDVMYADHFDEREMYRQTNGVATDATKKKEDEVENVFAIDYVKPLSDNSQLEAGAKVTSQKYNQHWKADFYPYLLDYDESTYAIYTTYGKELSDRFGIQGGLRYESVNISMDLNKTSDDESVYPDPEDNILYFFRDEALNNGPYSPPNYSKFFPSLHLMYTHNEEHSYKLGYSYRTERPWMRGLNPVPKDDLDENFIRIGNPNLQPEYTHAVELDYTLQKGRNSLTTSVFYNYSTDLIHWWDSDYIYFDGTTWTYEEPESFEIKKDVMQADNYGTSQRVGFDVTATYFPLPFWFSMVSTSAWYTMLGGENTESDLQGNAVGLYTFFMNRVFLPFGQVELTGNMFGPMRTTDGFIKPILGMNMAVQSSYKNVDITFKIKNLLDNAGFEIDKDEEFDDYTEYLHAYHYREPRTLMLSLKYSFGKVEESKRKQRKNKNMKRGGGGQDAISY